MVSYTHTTTTFTIYLVTNLVAALSTVLIGSHFVGYRGDSSLSHIIVPEHKRR